MKILIYSDLHLEFGTRIALPADGDLLVLAGDIITFRDFWLLQDLLADWKKPVVYVAGNHEYYTRSPMREEEEKFAIWIAGNLPQVHFLRDEGITIDGIHFFGGTMWTDFANADATVMHQARSYMNDYNLIHRAQGVLLQPSHTVEFHAVFRQKLSAWLEAKSGTHVVVSHHAPVYKPDSLYANSTMTPAFNSPDMLSYIEQYDIALWIYGHTHECDDQMVHGTRIISNQLGYPRPYGGFECSGFDPLGKLVTIKV